jgi:hypothetical protein
MAEIKKKEQKITTPLPSKSRGGWRGVRSFYMLPINKFPDYLVSSNGKIWSMRNRRFLRGCLSNGYCRVILYGRGGSHKRFKVHRLVLESFVSKPYPTALALHHNDIKTDDYLRNLYWGNHKDNHKDAVFNNKYRHADQKGERNPSAILTMKDVREIKDLYKFKTFNQKEIGNIYGVTNATISLIVLGKRWAFA